MAMANCYDELAAFILHEVEGLESGKAKGAGAYGAVCEVAVNGVPCIAKRLHDVLVNKEVSWIERKAIQKKFRQECVILSKLKHPNIVHFVGVHYGRDPGDLSLVMEKLDTDLGEFLDTKPNIPLSLKLSILLDVSYGLLYLHTLSPKPIIHRDLTANNILLTSDRRAKIADLGVSKLIDVHSQVAVIQTMVPGSRNYMPPEALKKKSIYGIKLDIFSFGHLALYVATQKNPMVYEVAAVLQDDKLQILKRKRSINEMGEHHCCYPLVTECLQDDPSNRPSTVELNNMLIQLCAKYPNSASCCNTSEVIAVASLKHQMMDEDTQNGKLGSSALAMSLQRESSERFALERKNAELEKVNDKFRLELQSLHIENEQLKRQLENVSNSTPQSRMVVPFPQQYRQSYPPSPERRAAAKRHNVEKVHTSGDTRLDAPSGVDPFNYPRTPTKYPPPHHYTNVKKKTHSVPTFDSSPDQMWYTCLKCGQQYGHSHLFQHTQLCPERQK